MSDDAESETTETFTADETADETVAAPRPRRARPKPAPEVEESGSSQRLMLVALVVAALAVIGAGGYYWYSHRSSSSSSSSSSYSEQETKDAKAEVCKASVSVFRGVARNTHLQNPVQNDPIGSLAVAANARLALSAGGAYLRGRLAELPATPQDLDKAVRGLADTLEGLGISYLAGEPNEAREALRQDLESRIKTVGEICK